MSRRSRLPLLAPWLALPWAQAELVWTLERQRRGRWRRRRGRPRPQLVCGLPMRLVDGRTPARQRRRGRISTPDADGWREVLHRQQTGPAATSAVSRTGQLQHLQPRKIPAELHGRCFNCLSSSHRVATCRSP